MSVAELPARATSPPPAHAPARTLRAPGGFVVAALAALAVVPALVAARDVWAVDALLLALVLTLPGLLALRAMRVPAVALVAFPVYVPAASLVVLMAVGLVVDFAGPPLGIARPLATWPLLGGLEAVCVALLAAGAGAPAPCTPRLRAPRLRRAWPLVLPVAAAAGAERLTTGHGAGLAVATAAAGAVMLLACGVLAPRLSRVQLATVLFSIALAAMWAFSLRGHSVYGFDIASEYHVATSTIEAGRWHAAHPHDAYGAMLSLTVLPVVLHAVAGASTLFLLKALYPLLFALFPVALFCIATRFASRRAGFLAAAFVLAQPYFFQQIPALARQEVSLLLFVALVAALLDRRLPRAAAGAAAAAFGLGVVVSHYSTTYLAAGLLAGAVVLQLLVSLARPLPRASAVMLVALVAILGGSAVWYGAVTHSTSNLSDLSANVREHGLDLLPNAKHGQSLLSSYLAGSSSTRESAQAYQRSVTRDYRSQRRYVHPLPAASEPRYALRDASIPGSAPRIPTLDRGLDRVQLVLNQLFDALAALSAIALAVRRGGGTRLRQVGLLGVATLGMLALLRLSGTAANAYNQQRAFVQTMVPLAVALAWTAQAVASRRRPRVRQGLVALASIAVAVTLVNASGLRAVLVGGGRPTNLAARGEDYERFYMTPAELAGARWVAGAPSRALLYADRYGQLRILAASGRAQGLLRDVTPPTIDGHAWVYATRANRVGDRARGEADSRYALYAWPATFLHEQFDTVYDNGSSAVYHR